MVSQLMKLTYTLGDAEHLKDIIVDALASVHLELIAFFLAILLYSIVFRMRVSKGKASNLDVLGIGPKQSERACGTMLKENTHTGDSGEGFKRFADSRTQKLSPHSSRTPGNVPSSSRPDVAKHIMMIRKCATENNLKGAMNIFETLAKSGAELNAIVYNTVLDACVKCKDLEAAEFWMEKARQAGMIDVASYNTLLKAHLVSGDIHKARSVVRDMKSSGMQPNRVTFNEFVNAVVTHGGSSKDVWEVVKEMREMGIPPNQVTCSILLKNLSARSAEAEVDATMDLIASLDGPMDEVLMSSVVEACVRVGNADLLTKKLGQLQASSRISNSHTFGSLIKAYGHAHDIAAIWRCWKDMRSQLIKPTSITVGCMVEALVNNSCTEDAYELIHTLQYMKRCSNAEWTCHWWPSTRLLMLAHGLDAWMKCRLSSVI
jgi:pentatricopeptide repeat protein